MFRTHEVSPRPAILRRLGAPPCLNSVAPCNANRRVPVRRERGIVVHAVSCRNGVLLERNGIGITSQELDCQSMTAEGRS